MMMMMMMMMVMMVMMMMMMMMMTTVMALGQQYYTWQYSTSSHAYIMLTQGVNDNNHDHIRCIHVYPAQQQQECRNDTVNYNDCGYLKATLST